MSVKIDPHSQTWLNINAYIEERMTSIRSQLESDLDHQTTSQLRARLQELKMLIGETRVEAPLLDIEEYVIPG